jgi:decaprenylphospho-beta-D-ribofuranose 2-oxidase
VTENNRVGDLDSMLVELQEMNDRFPHTVAWIDLSGDFRGRGIVSGGRHALLSDLSKKAQLNPLQYVDRRSIGLPDIFPSGVMNSATMRAFNEVWFRKPLGSGVLGVQKFMHPLDGVGAWNRIYGKSGFLQYQFVVPFDQIGFIRLVLAEMKKLKVGSFLGVLKSFGVASKAHLSFPFPGWTLAVDIPANVDGLDEVLSQLDEKLVEVGGRIYLTKDARMSSELVRAMYPRIDEWREIREQMDPNHIWQSDQSRRLRLCAMD